MLNIVNSGGYKKCDTLALVRPQDPQTGKRSGFLVPIKVPSRFCRFIIAICGSKETKDLVKSFEEGAHSAKLKAFKVLSQQYGEHRVLAAFERNGYQLEWRGLKGQEKQFLKREAKPLTERLIRKIKSEVKCNFEIEVHEALDSLGVNFGAQYKSKVSDTVVGDDFKMEKFRPVQRPPGIPGGVCAWLESMSMKLARIKCRLMAYEEKDLAQVRAQDVAQRLYGSAHQEIFDLYSTLKEGGTADNWIFHHITSVVQRNEEILRYNSVVW